MTPIAADSSRTNSETQRGETVEATETHHPQLAGIEELEGTYPVTIDTSARRIG